MALAIAILIAISVGVSLVVFSLDEAIGCWRPGLGIRLRRLVPNRGANPTRVFGRVLARRIHCVYASKRNCCYRSWILDQEAISGC